MNGPAADPSQDGSGHAVVIGASIGGLVAARALSERYHRVTLVDRDLLPDGPQARRGVPQGRQLHVLLARGAQVLDELFPGFLQELVDAGASFGDAQKDGRWYLDGNLLHPAPSDLRTYGASRPLIESVVRKRVAALPGVETIQRTEVSGLLTTPDRRRARGVRLQHLESGTGTELAADLVVDASGRGSRAAGWLRDLGYPEIPESRVEADVVYVTRHYRPNPHLLDGRLGVVIVPFPGLSRGGAVIAEESGFAGEVWGLLGEVPPTDPDGMLAYAKTLAASDVADFLMASEPLDDPVMMRYPTSVRRHFEQLDRYLDGFLVFGDALCSFNPTYGQGMSTAAVEALCLRSLLAKGPDIVPKRYYRKVAKIVDIPWSLAAGGDLRFPEATGDRRTADRLVNKYLDRYRRKTAVDPVLGRTLLRVLNLLDPPTRLMSPSHVLRVFRPRPMLGPSESAEHAQVR